MRHMELMRESLAQINQDRRATGPMTGRRSIVQAMGRSSCLLCAFWNVVCAGMEAISSAIAIGGLAHEPIDAHLGKGWWKR